MSPAPPSPDQLAAIVAALEAAWPRLPAPVAPAPAPAAWRFSGRWWNRPVAARRERP